MITEELLKRRLPDPLVTPDGGRITSLSDWPAQRERIKALLSEQEYGFLPEAPDALYFRVVSSNERFCASRATLKQIVATVVLRGGAFSFPFAFGYPNKEGRFPAVVHLDFGDAIPTRYLPAEEILDHDIAFAHFFYKDVTSDDWDFTNGLSGILFPDGRRGRSDTGKISMWAWAAMRIMDFLMQQDNIDKNNIAVAGHSRLGKTALYTGAFDDRFAFAFSNDSGSCGAALSRGKMGQDIHSAYGSFGFWFCENYAQYVDREYELPFDQHFLHALIAPRSFYVASAEEDLWADPQSEYLACVAAEDVYRLHGLSGLVHPDRFPEIGETMHEGEGGYHLRQGSHYFSRHDWLEFFKFMKRHAR